MACLVVGTALVGAVLLGVTNAQARNVLVVVASAIIAGGSLGAAVMFGNGDAVFFGLPGGLTLGHATLIGEALIGATILVISIQNRRILAPTLVIAQLAIAAYLELGGHLPEPDPNRIFWFDRLSMVMILVIGLVGPLICIHALGYMRDYHRANPMVKGRRTVFFSLLFIFLAAMFGLVVANDLPLLLVFWEVTTLCSFLLIGYTRTEETIGYAFRALNMNLFGGLGFSVAILLLAGQPDGLDLARLTSGPAAAAVLPAIALLALAGLTKSAQMPFSSWLLGAMYAPSPTSALLHSSTMVKAGVFLLLRLSPAMGGSIVGTLVTFVGLLTFLFVSSVAVTEQNTKKILAYSTIGNLGLVAGCAGIGTPETAWVGVMIIIFHAVAKALLFLVVGTLENRLYTKDLENFDALLSRMPRVSILALAGIAGMFIAPFGIVVAKWAAIRAFLEIPGWVGAALVVIMAFGSALTIFYWGKLLIKVLSMRRVDPSERAIENRVTRYEWFAESVLAAGVLLVAAGLGVISQYVAAPYAVAAFPFAPQVLPAVEPAVIILVLVAELFLPVLAVWAWHQRDYDAADFYASGRSTQADRVMGAALGGTRVVTLRGYYLDGVLDGALLFRAGTLVCGFTLAAMVLAGMVVHP
jgi:ech hydrogenase subunit A